MTPKTVGTISSLVFMFGFLAATHNPLWTDVEGSTQALKDQGFTPIKVGGYDMFACDTIYATEFTATNANGDEVKGAVCRGLLNKSYSVHTF